MTFLSNTVPNETEDMELGGDYLAFLDFFFLFLFFLGEVGTPSSTGCGGWDPWAVAGGVAGLWIAGVGCESKTGGVAKPL